MFTSVRKHNYKKMEKWFESSHKLEDFVIDLIMAEISAIRIGLLQPLEIRRDTSISVGEDGLGLDSLEIMSVSTSLSRTLHLNESSIEENFFDKKTIDEWQSIVLKSLNVFSESISFKTSGSIGLKKYHTHCIDHLEKEAAFLSQQFTGRKRVLRAVPSHHIYGFIFTALLPRYLGANIEVLDIRNISANALKSIISSGDLVIGYPEFWQSLDEYLLQLPVNIVGVSSSGPCPSQVGTNLIQKGMLHFFEIFGSTETAGIGWRKNPLSEYTLFPFWKKMDFDNEISRLNKDCKLVTHKLQDALSWSSSTEFTVEGRIDNIVQVGGINVSLDTVCNKLKAHPLIKDISVRMMLPEEGARLKAFIVLKDSKEKQSDSNKAFILKDIQHFINNHLETSERPKSITFGINIPKNKMGKHCDWAIEQII